MGELGVEKWGSWGRKEPQIAPVGSPGPSAWTGRPAAPSFLEQGRQDLSHLWLGDPCRASGLGTQRLEAREWTQTDQLPRAPPHSGRGPPNLPRDGCWVLVTMASIDGQPGATLSARHSPCLLDPHGQQPPSTASDQEAETVATSPSPAPVPLRGSVSSKPGAPTPSQVPGKGRPAATAKGGNLAVGQHPPKLRY